MPDSKVNNVNFTQEKKEKDQICSPKLNFFVTTTLTLEKAAQGQF